jgi:hypothetical protein
MDTFDITTTVMHAFELPRKIQTVVDNHISITNWF